MCGFGCPVCMTGRGSPFCHDDSRGSCSVKDDSHGSASAMVMMMMRMGF
jgi:hypothetical protein